MTDTKLEALLEKAAESYEKTGLPIDGEFGGAVHLWCRENINYRPDTEFFVVTLLTAELADREARREGFDHE